jgi:protein involved in polysaccharide export with SLBB domain
MSSRSFLITAGVCVFACLSSLQVTFAQQQRSTRDPLPSSNRPPVSALDKENSSRVAAAPELIRQVLVKDPGLLVELKYITAEEATANGQIVDDSELTDQAIFDRLTDDIVFRAMATRLVQHYGYLLPTVNPDSEIGKQQELLLKERARRMVQIEAQEDSEFLKPKPNDSASPLQQTSGPSCDPKSTADCDEPLPRSSWRDYASPAEPPANAPDHTPAPTPRLPRNTNPAILQTGLGSGVAELSNPLDAGSDSPDHLHLAAMNVMRGSAVLPDVPPDSSALSANGAGAFDSYAMSVDSAPENAYDKYGKNDRSRSRVATSRQSSSWDTSADSPQGPIVHKNNPYADVPSLYDLYVQVAARDRAPERFGVSILNSTVRQSSSIPMDLPVGPDYVVGPGDGLAIDLWGGVSQRLLRTVDRQGRISLPEAGPVLVSGRSLGDVQFTIQQLLRAQYRDVSADVSLSRLHTVRVYVVGEVREPGAYDLSSLSSPLNALVAAGGVTMRGSLRAIKHYRSKQLVEVVDAYDLLLRGVGPDQKRLENGDSLLIPPAGPQVTIEGMVRRPAIYELDGNATSLEDALELAGGVLPAAALKHVEVERLVAHENRTMLSLDLTESGDSSQVISQLRTFQVHDGDRIHIFPIAPYNDQAIYLQGHVLRPGRYSFRSGLTLTDLITSYSDLLPEPSGKYAEIVRLNPPDFRPTVESFDLSAALANPSNAPKLHPLDTVRIFSKYDFEPAPDVSIGGEVRHPGQYTTSGQARFRDAIYLAGGLTADADLVSAQVFRTAKDGTMTIISVNLNEAISGAPTSNILLEPRDRIVIHRNASAVQPSTVYVKGDVAKPGRYPLTADMRVQDLIHAAGGLKPSADMQDALLTHPNASLDADSSCIIDLQAALAGNPSANSALANGDVLTIRQNPGYNNLGASVTLRGEVVHPGTYGIRPDEPLSSVITKAGGLAPQAYAYGIVLARSAVRDLQTKSQLDLIARVQAEETQLKALPENDTDQKNLKLQAIAQTETTLTQLQTHLPIGRVVIHSSPDAKSFDRAAEKTPLRNGDSILIPKKPNYVMVQGQVYNSTAVGYISGRSAKWYLSQAGGVTQLADKKAVFVIRADGSVLAAKNNGTMWSGNPMDAVLVPGDLIVVPEKAPQIAARNWLPLIQSAQVATSIALAVAYFKP